jgi:hypothetical protein
MNPLDQFWKGSDEMDDFPVLTSPKAKDIGVGILKGVGQTVFDTGKLVGEAAPKAAATLINPLGAFAPQIKNPLQPVFDKVEPLLQGSNVLQQQAKDVEQITEWFIPFLGLGAKAITKAPAFARSLEEVSMRLSSTEKLDLGRKLETAKDFMVKNGITGSPDKRLTKVDEIYNTFESKLDSFLKTNNTTKGFWAPREVLIKDLNSIKNQFRNDRDYLAIKAQVDDAIKGVQTIFTRSKIPVDRLNEYKRSVFNRAFNRAGTKVIDDVEFAIGDKVYDLLKKSLRGATIDDVPLDAFNKEYTAVVTARKILKKASERPELGNWGRFISSLMGAGIGTVTGGGALGAATGAAAGTYLAPSLAGTAVRSNIGKMAETIGSLSPQARKSLGTLLLGSGLLSSSRLERLLSGDESDDSPLQPIQPETNTELSPQSIQALDSFKR